jgi:16S rRNA (cytidine1402-2'-O)-methyltransferase
MVATLADSELVLCEDTRVTAKLMSRFSLSGHLVRADEHTIASRIETTLDRIERGAHVSFVSDAGMPSVSDPGQKLVDACLDAGVRVEVIPGPSAVVCALVASGLASDHFFFEGFLPRKEGARRKRIEDLAPIPGALIFFESPHRVKACLASIEQVLPTRRVALVRELTKVHEQCLRDLAPALAARVREMDEVRGECVIVVERPLGQDAASQPEASLDEEIRAGLAADESKSALAKRLAKACGLPRSEVYDRVLALGRE